ncbi:MAG: TRAP transporter small permease [Pseudomonadota bacterium]
MYRALDRSADIIARTLAFLGGLVLVALIILNTISIIGRAFVPLEIGIRPIRGIYDMTEIGMAIAIFAFMPWAQFKEAHARVDLFQHVIPPAVDRFLDLLFNIAMAAVAYLIASRLYLGMLDKQSYGETTLIAQIPVWWGFAGGLVGAVGFAIVAIFCVIRAARRLAGRPD